MPLPTPLLLGALTLELRLLGTLHVHPREGMKVRATSVCVTPPTATLFRTRTNWTKVSSTSTRLATLPLASRSLLGHFSNTRLSRQMVTNTLFNSRYKKYYRNTNKISVFLADLFHVLKLRFCKFKCIIIKDYALTKTNL